MKQLIVDGGKFEECGVDLTRRMQTKGPAKRSMVFLRSCGQW